MTFPEIGGMCPISYDMPAQPGKVLMSQVAGGFKSTKVHLDVERTVEGIGY